MTTFEKITVPYLQQTSKTWNRQTKELLVFVGGSGSMFGGSNRMIHFTLHGENSRKETGFMEVKGVLIGSYNIARGANGPSSARLTYYRGVTSFEEACLHEPTYIVTIEGDCGGANEAMCHILNAQKDWINS